MRGSYRRRKFEAIGQAAQQLPSRSSEYLPNMDDWNDIELVFKLYNKRLGNETVVRFNIYIVQLMRWYS